MSSKWLAALAAASAASIGLVASFPSASACHTYRVCAAITEAGKPVYSAPAITVEPGNRATVAFDVGRETYQLEVRIASGGGQHSVSVLKTTRTPDQRSLVCHAPIVTVETGGTATAKFDGNGFDVRVEKAS